MIDEKFIRYAIAEKTAQKKLCDNDVDRRVQLEREISHWQRILEFQSTYKNDTRGAQK